jgi:GxxExxY protein
MESHTLILGEEIYANVGATMEVHRTLGPGFFASVYKEALALEYADRSIPFDRQQRMTVRFKGHVLSQYFVADFVCFEQVVVEMKALNQPSGIEQSQLLNYLKASGCRVGVLANFGSIGKLK